MWSQPYEKVDLESGRLYPMMLERAELRWSFIRKIYSIVTIQMLLTIAVASVVVFVHPVSVFFTTTGAGLAIYIILIITPFIGMIIISFANCFKNSMWVFDSWIRLVLFVFYYLLLLLLFFG